MELLEKIAIQELTARYTMAVDGNDVDTYLTLWTPDGVAVAAYGLARGHQQLRERFVGMQQGMSKHKRHQVTNFVIHLNGKKATQRCYLVVFDRQIAAVVGTGVYDDELVKTPDGWRFSKRTLQMDASHRSN